MLTAEDIKSYRDNGYLVVRNIFTSSEVEELARACDDLVEKTKDLDNDTFINETFVQLFRPCNPFDNKAERMAPVKGSIRRATYPYSMSETFNKYRTQERLMEIVKSLLGHDVVQIVNQVNFNPPGQGTGWGWHQDYRFRKEGIQDFVNDYVQCLTAIDPVTSENGGLRLIPKSSQLGGLKLDIEQDTAEEQFDVTTSITPQLNPGDVVMFNTYTIHSSTANKSDKQRRVFINGYAKDANMGHGIPVLQNGKVTTEAKGYMEFEPNKEKLPLASKY